MCGIAGLFTAQHSPPPPLEELKRMIAVQGHRGPDGYGFYRDGRVGLAHARLSIVGLADGFQPIRNEDGTIWITFNGEIFNHQDLRAELESRGHRFATRSDTEVIVHAYEEWGAEAWSLFNGQFAFALWDTRDRRLWLVRDPLGVLPLHYAHTDGAVSFASEVKGLLAGGRVAARFDPARLAQVFTHWSASPHGSVFAGVAQVPPGTALAFDSTLSVRAHRYHRPDLSGDPALARISVDEAAEELSARLDAAVRLRLRADVPVGVYISGGLDSSVIAALACRAHDGEADRARIHSFGVRFTDRDFDETPQQRLVAAHVGTDHHEILVDAAAIRASLPDVVWHAETPLLRTAPAPMFRLSGLVQDSGIRVVLSGEGADELLGGYDLFKEDAIRRFWARQPDSAVRPQLLGRIHPFAAAQGAKTSPLWQSFFRKGLADTADPFYAHAIRWRNTGWAKGLLADPIRAHGGHAAELDALLPPGWQDWPPLARAQAVEIADFMTPYLLASQGDRVAMAHGVEVRYPFLDPAVVAFCHALPARVKMLGLRDKLALRRAAKPLLPPEIGARPKRPYRAPMTTALFGAQAPDYVHDLLSPDALDRYGLADARAVAALAARAHARDGRMAGEREEMALVGVLTLQLLARAVTDDFPARAAAARRRLDDAPLHILVDRAPDAAADTAAAVA